MSKEQISDFDKEYKKEKQRKNLIIGAAVAVALIFCLLILYLSLPENIPNTEKLQGTMTSATSVHTKEGDTPAIKVTLDNGSEITLLIGDGLVYKQNSKIVLKKVTSTTGIDSYQFINYVP